MPTLEQRVAGLLAADRELLADPYPIWNELRDRTPVCRVGHTVILTRHRDVRAALGDNNVLYSRSATRRSPSYRHAEATFGPAGRAAFGRVLDHEFHQFVRMDPPHHLRNRKVVTPPFSARSLVREMRERIDARVRESLDRAEASGDVIDFKKFAYTFPLEVLGDLLGIPLDDLDAVHGWAACIAENKFNADSERDAIAADEAYAGLLAYIDRLIERQRATGRTTGLVAALIDAEDNGVVSRAEARSMTALMIFAGHETTSNLLAIGTLELLRRPEQWKDLCADPSSVPIAVEELLRFVSPAQFTFIAADTPQVLDGVEIHEGDVVVCAIAAANRDPSVFTRPDELDLRRDDSRHHVALGMGPHFCLGAGLARMEAAAMFTALIQHFPDLALLDDDLRWGGRSLRTPLSMPVRLRP
jgi:cytochrome P450